jgi:hypothetical protein
MRLVSAVGPHLLYLKEFAINLPESNLKESVEQIQKRIKPLLDARSVDSLAAWLKTVSLPSSKSRPVIEELIAKSIASGDLVESALERALIGFEESSDMRILLFTLEDVKHGKADKWMPSILSEFSIPAQAAAGFRKGTSATDDAGIWCNRRKSGANQVD